MGAARIDQIFAFCPLISARCQGVGVGPGPRLLDVNSHSLQSCNPFISMFGNLSLPKGGDPWRGLEAVNLFSPFDGRARTVP